MISILSSMRPQRMAAGLLSFLMFVGSLNHLSVAFAQEKVVEPDSDPFAIEPSKLEEDPFHGGPPPAARQAPATPQDYFSRPVPGNPIGQFSPSNDDRFQQVVTVNLTDMPFQNAIRHLSETYSFNAVMEEGLPDNRVSFEVTEVTLQSVLNLLINQAEPRGSVLANIDADGTFIVRRNPAMANPAPGPDKQWTVVYLQYASARDAAMLLEQLVDDSVTIVPETRTNALFLRGGEKQLKEVQELIKVLDAQPSQNSANGSSAARPVDPFGGRRGSSSFGGGFSRQRTRADSENLLPPSSEGTPWPVASLSIPTPGDSNGLQEAYNHADQQCRQLAAKWLECRQLSGDGTPELVALKSQLQQAVRTAFAKRQELQRAELAAMTERLQNIERSLQTRDRLADVIVNRRVEELLNPDIAWTKASTGPEPTGRGSATPGPAATPPSPPATSPGAVVPDAVVPPVSDLVLPENEASPPHAPDSFLGFSSRKPRQELRPKYQFLVDSETNDSVRFVAGVASVTSNRSSSEIQIPEQQTGIFQLTYGNTNEPQLTAFAAITTHQLDPQLHSFLSQNPVIINIGRLQLDQVSAGEARELVAYIPSVLESDSGQ
ncbi:MAG: hypothetical protein KDA85_09550, partial [Planctomycetaceae bacterium]|nr:hypothetical protein [Planctomycetaceae bacterium]